ncbi:MAG: UDP-N-acetylmuramoyl-tripeptide--D-alanyl-D-alanine ligase [Thermoleophilaceae bacterium]|nr:UDP-N-acetylmuramoyl-tripeptide--D-alanyl-D-alanine ligase [Thermoleophilaceae bacterium]
MIELSAQAVAEAVGSTDPGGDAGFPVRAVIDSREVGPGDLFFGIAGEHADGGSFAEQAIERGAWGVVVTKEHSTTGANAFVVDDPTAALGALANRWRHELGAKVIGVTGSTGKTSTKDILAALLGKSLTVVATPANRNTEIGMPLTILSAPRGTQALVLEMAMRGPDQIDQLARIADPDVGCIVNVGPVHLEQLGSVEAVAAAKAELIAALGPQSTAVLPADESLLTEHFRDDIATTTFGPGGDVRLLDEDAADELRIATPVGEVLIRPSFKERYLTRNLLAAVACAQAVGAPTGGELNVQFSALRGEISEVLGGVTLINDCYNANPVSMRAALDNLSDAGGRRIAVLGGMGELGVDSARFHHEVGQHAAGSGVDFLITVGELGGAYGDGFIGSVEHVASPEAAAYVVRRVAEPGDTVLVKGSRSVGLEKVGEILVNASRPAGELSG